jgi:cobalamin biosynthesis Co2+ chelatase CbiK
MTVRQLMVTLQHGIDPEITILYGHGDTEKLKRLYSLNASLLYMGGFVLSVVAVMSYRVI